MADITHAVGDTEHEAVYGLLRLAQMELALPLSALREVVACPADLAPLPATAPGLLGAMVLRTSVLPIVDLQPFLNRDEPRGTDQVVVVVAHEGRLLGLLVDQVLGVAHVAQADLLAMTATGGEGRLLLSHTYRQATAGDPTVVSVLDPAALTSLPGVPTTEDTSSTLSVLDRRQHLSAGPGRTYTLVECGEFRLALDVAAVHTTLPSPSPTPSVLDSALCLGVTAFAGYDVPVVDPLRLLGLPAPEPASVTAGVVVDLGEGYVVLAVSTLVGLAPVADQDLLAVAPFAVPRAELLAGVADVTSVGPCLVLDASALRASPDLVSLARCNTGTGTSAPSTATDQSAPETGVADAGKAYLTYRAGADLASPLEQVAEIIPAPAQMIRTGVGGGLLGVVVHRGASVPIVALGELLGYGPFDRQEGSCLLLVTTQHGPVALAVDKLHGIESLVWSDPDHLLVEGLTGPVDVLRSCRLVRFADQDVLLPDLDLGELAVNVAGGWPAPVVDPLEVAALTPAPELAAVG